MKKVFLTGATGFVGSHMADALIEKGISLVLFARRRNNWLDSFEKRGATIVIGRNDDSEGIKKALDGVDTVIHIAGATRGLCEEDYLAANAGFTKTILSCVEGSTRFIFMSSQAAGGPSSATIPVTEETSGEPLTFYGKSKRAAEAAVIEWGKTHNNNFVILRPSSVFGPREKDIFTYFKLVKRGFLVLLGDGTKRISIIYVKDLVSATIKAAESDVSGGIFYVCNDDGVNWKELGESIKSGMDKQKIFTLYVPEPLAYPVAWVSDIIAFITKKPALLNNQKIIEMKQPAWLCSNILFKSTFSWKPRYTLNNAIRETAQWYTTEGWL